MKALGDLRNDGSAAWVRTIGHDAVAGIVAAVVLIANIVAIAALMFPGSLAQGTSTVIWAMLVGSGFAGAWIAWKTSLPPLSSGIDSPTGAVLVLLAASTGSQMLAAGASPALAIQTTLVLFTAATLTTGVLLLGLGVARWGSYLRFVPYFVVAGFLAATGWLLIVGGIRMTTGRGLGGLFGAWAAAEAAKLACAVTVVAVLLGLRRWVTSALALPVVLVLMAVALIISIRQLDLAEARHGWYLPSIGTLTPWRPWEALGSWRNAAPMPLATAFGLVPEFIAVSFVALVSMVSKMSALKVARKTSGDLDVELRAHGAATLVVAPFGGLACNLQLGTSRLLEHAGGATRLSGVFCALVLAFVGLSGFDVPSLIPLPIAAGMLFYLGWNFLVEALGQPIRQRAWINLLMALAIAATCVRYGYLVGVISGIVAACLLFAVSYARIGAVRQHLSRVQFAGNVNRSVEATRHLSDHGEAIQVYWLSGYIFFGSSEGVFERVRQDLGALTKRPASHVILDFSMVTGADASATVSLTKLRDFCARHSATLVFASLSDERQRALLRDGFFSGKNPSPHFGDVNSALAWCEEQVLVQDDFDAAGTASGSSFQNWLEQQLGSRANVAAFMPYLVHRALEPSQVLYRQGDRADGIDLVAAGSLVVEFVTDSGQTVRARRIATNTVVGEMGFFRNIPRSATVSAEGAASLYTLPRGNFETLQRERPDVAHAFYEFLLRTLADRISLSEQMVAALSPRATATK